MQVSACDRTMFTRNILDLNIKNKKTIEDPNLIEEVCNIYNISGSNAENNQGDGGSSRVLASVEADETALINLKKGENSHPTELAFHWKRTRRIFSDERLCRSYGILDCDYKKNYKLDTPLGDHKREDHVVINKGRYSLENYVFDPIIFCSVLNIKEIKKCMDGSKLAAEGAEKEKFIRDCEIIHNILLDFYKSKRIKRNSFNELQNSITDYFLIIFKVMYKYKMLSKSIRKGMEEDIYKKMKTKTESDKKDIGDRSISFIANEKSIFYLRYPSEFLEIRGHDIENFFFKKGNTKQNPFKPVETIIGRIYHHKDKLKIIPFDLADIFFELNEKVRKNIRAVIKPDDSDQDKPKTIHQFFRKQKSNQQNNWECFDIAVEFKRGDLR